MSLLTIQRIETDKVSPSAALLSDIAYHLHYPLAALVTEEKSVVHIKGNEQPVIESQKLKLKILAHKGAIHEKISVTLP